MSFRTYIRKVHLYIGLGLGTILVILGLTGSMLVYRHSLVRWLHPDLMVVEPRGEPEIKPLLEAARNRFPDRRVNHVRLPSNPDASAELWFGNGEVRVYGNPYTGKLLGTRHMRSDVMGVIHSLHIELLTGSSGRTVLGVLGLIYLVLIGTGLVLWWPGWRHVQRGLTLRWSRNLKSLNFQAHELIGFYTSLLLLISVLTGIGLCFYGTSRALLESLFGGGTGPPPPSVERRKKRDGGSVSPVDRCLKTARTRFPDSRMTWVHPAKSPEHPLSLRFRTPPEYHPEGNSAAYFDPATGEYLGAKRAPERGTGTRLYRLIYPLHGGFIGGEIVKIFMVLLGFIPAVLFGTGVTIWWYR